MSRSAFITYAPALDHYKDLEQGKWVKVEGWGGPDEAAASIKSGVARYDSAKDKPKF